MVQLEVTVAEVERASRLVFGVAHRSGLPAGDWAKELRRAFRRRVLDTHPDRAAALGRPVADLTREFKELTEAHALLERLATGLVRLPDPPLPRPAHRRSAPSRPPRPARAAAPRTPPHAHPHPPPHKKQAARPEHFTRNPVVPPRQLRIAEYLYYSGVVSWRAYIAAVMWQRLQRPSLGRLAVEWGHLSERDVEKILRLRQEEAAYGELFGEFALRKGFLSAYQLYALVGHQRRLQRPIGGYFIDNGLLDEETIAAATECLRKHNGLHRR